MRKILTLTFALVFLTGTAFAQDNSSSVTQEGDGHAATVTQVGADNASVISQFEDGTLIGQPGDPSASATVSQTGNDNVSLLDQNAFFGNSDATITQIGDDNYSNLQTQNGGGVADVFMEGDGNELVSWRFRDRRDFGANQKNDNEFDLDILGDDNTVAMTQEFAFGDVDVTGAGNEVNLRQLSGANGATADFHSARIVIGGDGSTGNLNAVTVNQASESGGTGGVNNGATVKVLRGDANTVEAAQFGSDNRQTIEVDGSANTYTAAQTGSGNALYLNSRGTGQYFSGAGGVSNNTFSLTQDGMQNLVDAGLDGVGNSISITQDGSGNVVDGPAAGRFDADGLGIIGDDNSVMVMQTGSGHAADQMVMGNNNTISVTQSN